MKKFDELLVELKKLNIIQTNGGWEENIPDDIYDKYFINNFIANFEEVDCGLDVDTHRWYETSTTVIKIYDRFLGIQYITNMFSESCDYESCCVQVKFMEMKEIQTTSYCVV